MQHQAAARPKPGIGPVLVLLGGILVIVSGFTDWGKVSPPAQLAGSVTVKGSGIIMIIGIAIGVLGLAMWLVRSRGAHI